jgi:apoptosis-inducing factor 3
MLDSSSRMADMSSAEAGPVGPDLKRGIPVNQITDGGMLAGQVDGEPVLLVRRGAVFYAIGGSCSHYSGTLADGLLVGDTVRCPLHHACFDLRTGEAVHGPAISALPCYDVKRHLELVMVTGLKPPGDAPRQHAALADGRAPTRIVIVGAGAAGTAAAFALRRAGHAGELTLIGDERAAPYDRPNLSKSYLSGSAAEEWLPLQPPAAYDTAGIRLVLGTAVSRIDPADRTVSLEDGRAFPFDALLIATGANPIRPPIPGMDRPRVRTLRSRADSEALIELATTAHQAVVVGAGFLGLEAAASLSARGLSVQVVSPDAVPLAGPLGSELGAYVQRLHEAHGVRLRLRHSVTTIGEQSVQLEDGTELPAELVVVATGVRPSTVLAARTGLALAKGIQVDQYLETSHRGIFAAGDAVSWPDPRTGELTGCGHWSLAMRMGEVAASNMLGAGVPFVEQPFFWSEHYDLRINCTGNTEKWDRIEVLPGLPSDQWEQRFWRDGVLVGVATINRDHESLEAELALERQLASAPARTGPNAIPGPPR